MSTDQHFSFKEAKAWNVGDNDDDDDDEDEEEEEEEVLEIPSTSIPSSKRQRPSSGIWKV